MSRLMQAASGLLGVLFPTPRGSRQNGGGWRPSEPPPREPRSDAAPLCRRRRPRRVRGGAAERRCGQGAGPPAAPRVASRGVSFEGQEGFWKAGFCVAFHAQNPEPWKTQNRSILHGWLLSTRLALASEPRPEQTLSFAKPAEQPWPGRADETRRPGAPAGQLVPCEFLTISQCPGFPDAPCSASGRLRCAKHGPRRSWQRNDSNSRSAKSLSAQPRAWTLILLFLSGLWSMMEYARGCHCTDVSPHAGRLRFVGRPFPDSTRFPENGGGPPRRFRRPRSLRPESRGETPLHRAARKGHAACVELLLKAGAKKARAPPAAPRVASRVCFFFFGGGA